MDTTNRYILHLTMVGLVGCLSVAVAHAESPSPRQASSAAAAIAEYQVLCARDGGRLWGQSLCGPIMLVDRDTRTAFADRDTAGHDLRRQGDLFTGFLPSDVGIANTSTDWAGLRWTMVQLPLPSDRQPRDELLTHESFHRIQRDRLPPPNAPLPDHLDTYDGRVALRLEWRALSRALEARGESRRTAIRDALAFRAWRRHQVEGAAQGENAQEINEGLAEYTGRRLGDATDPARSVVVTLTDYDKSDGYVRSFAYASGPAYGLLLDDLAPGWRTTLRPDSDLGAILHHAIADAPLHDVASIRDQYGYVEISHDERAKAAAHDRQAARWKALLVDGPVIQLPLIDMGIEFNPHNLFVLPSNGTVYPNAVIRDRWGTLTVSDGVLVAADWKTASVAGPASFADSEYRGPGWSLKLAPGWALSHGSVERK
jgi:hypothetical protein